MAFVSETFEGLRGKLNAWKGRPESKGPNVNIKKTKMMVNSEKAGNVRKEEKFPRTI